MDLKDIPIDLQKPVLLTNELISYLENKLKEYSELVNLNCKEDILICILKFITQIKNYKIFPKAEYYIKYYKKQKKN